jgi:hypothetical protein
VSRGGPAQEEADEAEHGAPGGETEAADPTSTDAVPADTRVSAR